MTQIPFRAPAYPLINIDPYTSIWSMADRLTDDCPRFWTQKPCGMLGLVTIDGTMFRFMGQDGSRNIPAMEQTVVRFDSFSTIYTFEANGMELTAVFTSPLLPDDLLLLSRPVTYLKVAVRSLDGEAHTAEVRIEVSGRICLDRGRHRNRLGLVLPFRRRQSRGGLLQNRRDTRNLCDDFAAHGRPCGWLVFVRL